MGSSVEKATEVENVENNVYWRKRRKRGKWVEVCVESGKSQKTKKGEKWSGVGGRGDGKKRGVVERKGVSPRHRGDKKSQEEKVSGVKRKKWQGKSRERS